MFGSRKEPCAQSHHLPAWCCLIVPLHFLTPQPLALQCFLHPSCCPWITNPRLLRAHLVVQHHAKWNQQPQCTWGGLELFGDRHKPVHKHVCIWGLTLLLHSLFLAGNWSNSAPMAIILSGLVSFGSRMWSCASCACIVIESYLSFGSWNDAWSCAVVSLHLQFYKIRSPGRSRMSGFLCFGNTGIFLDEKTLWIVWAEARIKSQRKCLLRQWMRLFSHWQPLQPEAPTVPMHAEQPWQW